MSNRTRCDRLVLATGLGSLLTLAVTGPVSAQELRSRIEVNHRMYVPDGEGPFPAVITIPGCSGVSLGGPETDAGRPGDEADRLFRRHYPRMAERLREAGFMVLLIDYLAAEGVPNTCNGEIHPHRVGEYLGESVSFVTTFPDVDSSRLHVIGWSHGGAGVLAWLATLVDEPVGVRTAVAVYPGCGASGVWYSSLPVLMILAGADDITPPSVCNALVQSLPDNADVRVHSYPGARHGFDLTEGPALLPIGGGLTVGRDPDAGRDAWRRILMFLNRH